MVKTPEQVKNIIEDWVQLIGKSYENVTSINPNASFGFKFGDTLIYSLKTRPDRVTIETIIGFAPEHKEATAKLKDKEFQELIVKLIEPLAIARLGVNFGQDKNNPKQINHLGIQGYIDTDSMDRNNFFKEWDAVANFRQIIIKKIQIEFGVKGKIDNISTPSSDDTIYS